MNAADDKSAVPALVRSAVTVFCVAAGITGVIGGLVLAFDAPSIYRAGAYEGSAWAAGVSGAAVFLGGCACLIAALRAVTPR